MHSPRHLVCEATAAWFAALCVCWVTVSAQAPVAPPVTSPNGSFEVAPFAAAPRVVNPTGVAVDGQGRVFVLVSHTHFRPQNYAGPATDQVLLLEDTNGDGQADRSSVFAEGFHAGMDLAFHPTQGLVLAERSAIHVLADTNGDGRAEPPRTLVKLETRGNYPHNGLAGLSFYGKDGLNFGLGENLGEPYRLVAADGSQLNGEAEGGCVCRVGLDGSKLQRVATGFWNPFGTCVDGRGNVFAVDNDPDSSPPCRLLHVVEQGNYGYEFRYGRSGLHPFQCWNGELPGTLPQLTGVGEGPCEILSWNGGLLVASWADNRIEYYQLQQQGLSFSAERQIVVQGSLEFRPVGMALAPDGSLYVTDWGTASYELKDTGRVWRLKPTGKMPPAPPLPAAVKAEPLPGAPFASAEAEQLAWLSHGDPFVRHLNLEGFAESFRRGERKLPNLNVLPANSPTWAQVIVAARRSGLESLRENVLALWPKLEHREARLVILKWIADERLEAQRAAVESSLLALGQGPGQAAARVSRTDVALHLAVLERLNSPRPAGALPEKELVRKWLADARLALPVRAHLLGLLPSGDEAAANDFLRELAAAPQSVPPAEVFGFIQDRPSTAGWQLAAQVLENASAEARLLHGEALASLAGSEAHRPVLWRAIASNGDQPHADALRALINVPLSESERAKLVRWEHLPEVARLLGKLPEWPPSTATEAWLAALPANEMPDEERDRENGRRVFFHKALGMCGQCHRVEGRGGSMGPDLTHIGRRGDRVWLLTTLLEPSRHIGPAYQPWTIRTRDGRTLAGISLRKGGGSEDYYGFDGKEFRLRLDEIEFRQESPTSLMPEGLARNLTPRELRDLLTFLAGSR